jgi:hypothetical protein
LEVLADPDLEPARAAWVLGLCYDLTGLNTPSWRERTALGAVHWVPRWPSADGPELAESEWSDPTGGSENPEGLAAYARRWLALRDALVVEYVD